MTTTYYGSGVRSKALRRFALTTTIVTILGHAYFGFEQAYVLPLIGLLSAYSFDLVLEWARSVYDHDTPRFAGGVGNLCNFLLPAHIVGLTCAMFLYPGDRVWPIVFAVAVSIGTKTLLRARINGVSRHFLNPSNAGILVSLVGFPAIGIILPYQFHSHLGDVGDVLLPLTLFVTGTLINGRVTGRLPLVVAWLGAFVAQAVFRYLVFDATLWAMLGPATGTVAILFTFYMVTDPGTTPDKPWHQVAFGSAVGLTYGALVIAHVVFAIFWALFLVCWARGIYHLVATLRAKGGGTSAGVVELVGHRASVAAQRRAS